MPSTSKLDACGNRYGHQIQKLLAFMKLVQEPLATADSAIVQTAREIVIVSVAAHLDEFLNCAVGLASVHRADDVRAFLAAHGNEEEKNARKHEQRGGLDANGSTTRVVQGKSEEARSHFTAALRRRPVARRRNGSVRTRSHPGS